MSSLTRRSLGAAAASGLAALAVSVLPIAGVSAAPTPTSPVLTASAILSGLSLQHTYTDVLDNSQATEPLTKPDDITTFQGFVIVAFQNGVGPQGQPSADGNTDSTIVAMDKSGNEVAQWDIQGRCDGLTADPAIGGLIATVNEDANSSLYTITGGVHGFEHYTYSEPLPHNGGTDAISVDAGGRILITASAPGTTGTLTAPQPTFPAVYSVSLDVASSVAKVTPYFYDEDPAAVANTGSTEGQKVPLALTDPDSSEIVPAGAPRFAHDFMLTSQGDLQQIFVSNKTNPSKSLSVLNLSESVDDTQWAQGPGVLFATDSTHDAVDVLSGSFGNNPIVAATPCGENAAPSTCPGGGFGPNYLGSLNPWTGVITPITVTGAPFVPQGGLLFMSNS